jgi:hypothetical protein
VHYAGRGSACIQIAHLIHPRIEPEIQLHFARTPPLTRDETAILECVAERVHLLLVLRALRIAQSSGVALEATGFERAPDRFDSMICVKQLVGPRWRTTASRSSASGLHAAAGCLPRAPD